MGPAAPLPKLAGTHGVSYHELAVPRPRFARLPSDKQQAILAAAMQQFANHGYERASFNRIIEQAGVSKGAMYYYFDDKEDLFNTVVHQVLEQALGEFMELPAAETPEQFWGGVHEFMTQALRFMHDRPMVARLIKSVLSLQAAGSGIGAVENVRALYRQWAEGFIRQAQAVGAIRSDLPFDLLVALTVAVASAGDVWLVEHHNELGTENSARFATQFLDMMRGAFGPR
jgi:TetR/AcrR family transcriptional regulator